jgi:hypothetical protein
MGQCVSRKAGAVIAASGYSPSYRIMEKKSSKNQVSRISFSLGLSCRGRLEGGRGSDRVESDVTRETSCCFAYSVGPTELCPYGFPCYMTLHLEYPFAWRYFKKLTSTATYGHGIIHGIELRRPERTECSIASCCFAIFNYSAAFYSNCVFGTTAVSYSNFGYSSILYYKVYSPMADAQKIL